MIGEHFSRLGLREGFLITQKVLSEKGLQKIGYIEIKTLSKDTLKESEKTLQTWENIFLIRSTEDLVSRISKEHLQINTKRIHNPMENWARDI